VQADAVAFAISDNTDEAHLANRNPVDNNNAAARCGAGNGRRKSSTLK